MKQSILVIMVAILILSGCTGKKEEIGKDYKVMTESIDTSKTYQFETEITLTFNTGEKPSEITQKGNHRINSDKELLSSATGTDIVGQNISTFVYYKDSIYYYLSENVQYTNGRVQYAMPVSFDDVVRETFAFPYYSVNPLEILKENITKDESITHVTYILNSELLATEFLERGTLAVLEGSNHQYKSFDKNDMMYTIVFDEKGFPTEQIVTASGVTIDNIPIKITYKIINITVLENTDILFPENLSEFPVI